METTQLTAEPGAAAHAMTEDAIRKGAMISGGINAVINGLIQFFLLRGHTPIPVTVNEINNSTHTVFGAAVPLAVSLAMILTAVAYTTVKVEKKPFWPNTVWLIFKHGMFAFGIVVSVAILWQRFFGSVEVGLGVAVLMLGLVAGVASAVVNYMSISAIVEKKG